MGYLPFNLVILQLVAPSSNMTKAEYKEAYGIDLDAVDIKSLRLIVFGNQKYAVDQIKEIEGGIEIYFNGRIMSITDIVQVSDEVYNVANATPIYWHGLTLFTAGGVIAFAHILKQTPTVLDTPTKLKAWFESITGEVILPLDGNIKIGDDFFDVLAIIKRATGTYDILYKTATGERADVTDVEITTYYSNCNDAVNKVN